LDKLVNDANIRNKQRSSLETIRVEKGLKAKRTVMPVKSLSVFSKFAPFFSI